MKKKAQNLSEDSVEIGELTTQKEAAEIMGASLSAVHDLVRRGRLRSVEQYGKRLVYRSEVENFERRPAGRPPKLKDIAEKSAAKKRVRQKDPTRLLKTLS